VTSTPDGTTTNVVVSVYLPGVATWGGCVTPGPCVQPTTAGVDLPVTSAQPDQPELPATTGAAPAGSTAAPQSSAFFTVLSWRLGTLPVAAARTIDYFVDVDPITRPRTEDVVTASGDVIMTATTAAGRAATLPANLTLTGGTVGAAVVEAVSVQTWPATARSVAAGLRSGRATTSSAAATTTTSASTTTSTTTNPGTGPDPFAAGSTTTTTPTSATTATTVAGRSGTTTTTSTTDAPAVWP